MDVAPRIETQIYVNGFRTMVATAAPQDFEKQQKMSRTRATRIPVDSNFPDIPGCNHMSRAGYKKPEHLTHILQVQCATRRPVQSDHEPVTTQ